MSRPVGFCLLLATTLLLAGCSFQMFPSLKLRERNAEMAFLEAAARQNPANDHALLMAGKIHLKAGRSREARQAFQRALKANPSLLEAEYGIALSYAHEERWSRSRGLLEDLTKRHPQAPACWEALATVAFAAGDLEAAETAGRKALGLDPESTQALIVLGNVAYVRGNYAEALAYWPEDSLPERERPILRPLIEDLEAYLGVYGERP